MRKTKKIQLSRETIRRLDTSALDRVAGGGQTALCGGSDACGTQLNCGTQAANGCLSGQKTVC